MEAVSTRGAHLPGGAVEVLQADATLSGAAIPRILRVVAAGPCLLLMLHRRLGHGRLARPHRPEHRPRLARLL